MPRAGWTKPDSDSRLSDHLAFAMLARVFPPDVVDQVVADLGRVQQRSRLLPSRIVVYYVLGLALFSHSSYDEVIRLLVDGQAWSSGWTQSWPVPTKAALYKARQRLGWEPIQQLFDRVARPLTEGGDGFHHSWRVLGIDSVLIDIPDTEANSREFGRRQTADLSLPGSPAALVLGLTEIASGAVIGASVQGADGDKGATMDFLSRIGPESLVIAGPGSFSSEAWRVAAATGAQLLWEAPATAELPNSRPLPDGSFMSHLPQHAISDSVTSPLEVRVVETRLRDGGRRRFVTTIADPSLLTPKDLSALISQHRNLASAFDEFRAHRSSSSITLRSKMPVGVRQEIYGYLCVHYSMRWLMLSSPTALVAPAPLDQATPISRKSAASPPPVVA
ncbi:hypothetical protein B7R54_15000 [Subtercola boreus]|uniref:Transposase IS4 N-terminal domain-containing protein n=1 Tax=Subtercola boreus TaxID=120213 RepID=A0A3E0VLM1_9MICO|nr:IS4 family transposase [Subtercola boreus]RFA10368.1 hypothetical protein B7R54_15000 [Subtercola boreus]TQL56118.1 IS4 family transposase [Subtercola boreus]